jgi:peroxiredoxin family protein
MTSVLTAREFKNFCYVVKSEDGNSYDVGVFMTFDGLKKYFKEEMEWKFNKNIKEDNFIKMCEDAYFTIDKMEIIDYNEFIVNKNK